MQHLAHIERRYAENESKKPGSGRAFLLDYKPKPGQMSSDIAALLSHKSKYEPERIDTIVKMMGHVQKCIEPKEVWTSAEDACKMVLQQKVNAHHITDFNKVHSYAHACKHAYIWTHTYTFVCMCSRCMTFHGNLTNSWLASHLFDETVDTRNLYNERLYGKGVCVQYTLAWALACDSQQMKYKCSCCVKDE